MAWDRLFAGDKNLLLKKKQVPRKQDRADRLFAGDDNLLLKKKQERESC